MPCFILESGTIPCMMYNLKTKGGTKLAGSADVEVVHKEKNQKPVGKQKIFAADMMRYLDYALNRVENS